MFSLQEGLPRLPVPPLQQTLEKFLRSAKPVLSPDEMTQAIKLSEDFLKPGSVGHKLQKMLEDRAKNTVNWLEEWWLDVAYLEYRLPSTIHVNPGVTFQAQNFSGIEDQLRYASRLIAGILDYKEMVDDQTLPVEYMGKKPLCMAQYFKILSSCRIPGEKKDSVVTFPPDKPNPPRHIIVMHNNRIFSMPAYGSDGGPLTHDQTYEQLHKIVSASQTEGAAVGILTSDNRNTWAKVYKRLQKDPHNKAMLDEIQRSIFVVCIDKPQSIKEQLDDTSVYAGQMNHGWGSTNNSGNRWFDKTIQFIVGSEGGVGLNYEHSAAEGPPIISLTDHALTYAGRDQGAQTPAPGIGEPTELKFNVDNIILSDIHNSSQAIDSAITDLEMRAFTLKSFGKDFIKSHKLSPDGFIQVAFQLTYYRLHGHNTATYESGSLRQFQHGRTDTIRSCTTATDNYVRAMSDSSKSMEERASLLRTAVQEHRKYTDWVITGQATDRHLLGLKLSAIEAGMQVPELFMDPFFAKMFHFRLSTSQVPSRYPLLLCFGPVVPDGYGICYNPMPQNISFCVSAWNLSPETSAKKFIAGLEESLNDASSLLIVSQKSKL